LADVRRDTPADRATQIDSVKRQLLAYKRFCSLGLGTFIHETCVIRSTRPAHDPTGG
jgi:hypothetical protein